MKVKKINETIIQIDLSRSGIPSKLLTWIIQIAISNPELLIKIIQALASLVKWAFAQLFDREGKPKTPWWMKLLGAVGVKPMKELRTVCDEACQAIEGLPEMPPDELSTEK